MIRATIGILAGQGGFDADAQAFFNRVDTAGGTLSTTEKNAVNTLVVQMKDDGIWSKMKAIYPMVGASAAACAQNLKSSSFTGSFSSGWSFATTGATPNGTSAYMDTGLNNSTELGLYDTHLSYYSRTNNTVNSRIEMGCTDVTVSTMICIRWTDALGDLSRINASYSSGVVYSDTRGHFISSRTNSTSYSNYVNGSFSFSREPSTSSQPNLNIYLGTDNRDSLQYFTNRECAFASIGDGLSNTEASDFYDAVQAFKTTLSRQV